MDQMMNQQAAIIAYANDFKLLTVICALSIPFVFFDRLDGLAARRPGLGARGRAGDGDSG